MKPGHKHKPSKRHHPLVRVSLFTAAIAATVILTGLVSTHESNTRLAGAVSMGTFCARALEVLCDCMADRLFPHFWE